jgi:eukaryotic-like serine/threonine-protein kinase
MPNVQYSILCTLIAICLLSLSSVPNSVSADWPRHRGDAALNGVSESKLGDSLQLLWNYSTGDFLKSSVVVTDNVAYVGSEDGGLHAITVDNGKQKWVYQTKMAIEAPPLLYDGKVIVGSTDGFLYCIEQNSGKLIWKYETMGEIMGAANQASRPKSKDDVIVFGSYDNFVHCLAADSGELLWKFEAQNYINGVPTIYENKYVVFGGCDAMLYVINLEDGKNVRSIEVEAPIAASVAIADGVGYVGDMDRSVTAFNLENGEVIWNYRSKSFPYFSSPALSVSNVFIGGRDKGMHCIDRVSGKKVWRFAARGRIDSSPVITEDKVVFGAMDGKLYLISRTNGEEIASYEIGEAISSTPAIVGNKIIVGCEDGNVYAFDTKGKK